MTTSRASAVKLRLIELFEADPVLGAIQVSYSTPAVWEQQTLFFGGTLLEHEIPTMKASRKQRQEVGEITCFVFRADPTDTPAEAEAGVLALVAAVEDILADDPSLGGTIPNLSWVTVDDIAVDVGVSEDNRFAAAAEMTLGYMARLT